MNTARSTCSTSPGEQVITEETSPEDTVSAILHDSGLAEAAALTPCPLVCRRCVQKREHAAASGRVDISNGRRP